MLSKNQNVVRYQYDIAVAEYSFSFPFWNKSEITVYSTAEDGTTAVLKQEQDYVITNPGETGKITLIQPLSDSVQITISRNVAITQDMDFKNGEPIDADNIEDALDSIVAMIQQVDEMLSRSILLSIADEGQNFVIPNRKERAEMVLGFDETGTKFKVYVNPQKALDTAASLREQMEQSVNYIKGIESYIKERLARAYQETIGDGSSLVYTINHNLETSDIVVQLWSSNSEGLPIYEVAIQDINTIKITFEEAIGTGEVSVVITTIKEAYKSKVQYEDISAEAFDKMAMSDKTLTGIIGE